jgi:GT2 family glycosyltransferase
VAPRASIVVPTHQRRASVLRLLDALHAQSAPPDAFEVVVAIDGSEDGTREALASYRAPFPVRAVWKPQGGRASACNTGARVAEGKIVVFLDDDMEPSPEFVAAHVAAHHAGEALGVVGAAPIVELPEAPPVVAYRARGFAEKMRGLAAKAGGLAFTDVYTGNFSIRRDVLLAAGGYDEAFRLYGYEDYELALRLGRAGVRFVFDQAAVARQHYAKSFRALADDTAASGQTAVLFARKHPEMLPSMYLGSFARRRWGERLGLRALLALSRVDHDFPSRAIAFVERLERRIGPEGSPALFACYDLVFDLVYWLGVERALADGAPPRPVRFDHVARRIGGTTGRADDGTAAGRA